MKGKTKTVSFELTFRENYQGWVLENQVQSMLKCPLDPEFLAMSKENLRKLNTRRTGFTRDLHVTNHTISGAEYTITDTIPMTGDSRDDWVNKRVYDRNLRPIVNAVKKGLTGGVERLTLRPYDVKYDPKKVEHSSTGKLF